MTEAPDLYAIRRELGGMVYGGGRRWVGPGPGHSRQDQSLSVAIADDGRLLIKSFAEDSYRECLRHLGFGDYRHEPAVERPDRAALRRELEAAERRRHAEAASFCRAVLAGSAHLDGTPAETYLRTRGLVGPFCRDLRFHHKAPLNYRGTRHAPAMVAVVRAPNGRGLGVHVTPIARDGIGKAPGLKRLIFGRVKGGAVQLAPMSDGVLSVAEGVETARSFTAIHGAPCWAVLSTSGLSGFEPPPGLRRLVIAADADDKGAGMASARTLAERVSASCEVVILPAPDGMDWNDALREVSE